MGDPDPTREAEAPPSRALTAAAFGIVYLVWGSTYLAIRFAIETLPPLSMAAARFLVAGALLYAWARPRGARPLPRDWLRAALAGGLMLLGGNGGVVWAEQYVASGLAALVVATVPLWMVLFEALRRGGERPSLPTVVGLVIGFVGVAVLVEPGASVGSGAIPWLPAGVLLLASASWAAGSLVARYLPQRGPGALGTSMQMLAGGALLAVAALLRGEAAAVDPGAASLRSLAALGYLIVFGSLVAYSAYVWLLKTSTPARVATYAYVNPVVAVVLGWAAADEALNWRVAAATLLVVAAVALVIRRRRPRRRRGGS